MLGLNDWGFVKGCDCRDREPLSFLRERFSVQQWLQQSKPEFYRMLAMRTLLSQQSAWNVSRMSDDAVLDQISDLLVSGRLHIHMQPTAPSGNGQPQRSTLSSGSAREAFVPFPLSEHSRSRATTSYRKPDIEPPTFSSRC